VPPGGNGSAPPDATDPAVLLGSLFGERWVSGVEVSIRRRGTAEPQVTEHGPLAAATDLDHERTQHLRHQGRADTLQSRADRFAQRAVRERLRAREERLRAERLEAASRPGTGEYASRDASGARSAALERGSPGRRPRPRAESPPW
jgi:hypothetical protein